MRIAVGADHRGYALRAKVIELLLKYDPELKSAVPSQ